MQRLVQCLEKLVGLLVIVWLTAMVAGNAPGYFNQMRDSVDGFNAQSEQTEAQVQSIYQSMDQ